MIVNFLWGFAEAGKSSFFKTLNGQHILDSSDFMYKEAARLKFTHIAELKRIKEDKNCSEEMREDARNTIIDFVENFLIKKYYGSRREFTRALLDSCTPGDKCDAVWVVAFNREENSYSREWFKDNYPDCKFLNHIIMRSGHNPGVDKRELPVEFDYAIIAHNGLYEIVDAT